MSAPNLDDPWAIPEDAIGVTTLIGQENGQWVVYLEVAFRDGVRRHRIQYLSVVQLDRGQGVPATQIAAEHALRQGEEQVHIPLAKGGRRHELELDAVDRLCPLHQAFKA